MKRPRYVLIFKAIIETRDSAAVTRLLASVPDTARLRTLVRSQFAETLYDPETRRDYWIGGDRQHILCLMITGVEVDEVTRIRTLFEQPDRHSFNLQDLASHAAFVTGGAVHVVD
jgi:hypothetical protein